MTSDAAMNNSMPIKDFINEILSAQEGVELEYKHAHGGFPGSFWETYSAFANTNGGIIVFGVKEKHDKYLLDPIDDELADGLLKTFWKQVRSKDSINVCLLSNDDIRTVKYEGSNIIIFNIPRAPLSDRPVYIGRDPMSGTFRRGHEGDYRCTPSEVRQMFADANTEVPADSRLLENFGLDDIDSDSLNQYRQRMAVANPDHVWLGLDDKQLLIKLGGYRYDRRTKKEGLTVAGLLMFGKWSSIRDVDGIPNYGVDYREYTENSERWSHRIFSDGSWEGNLFQFFYRILPRLQSVIDVPFRLEGNTRVDQKSAHKSIREALVNALIHAAYTSVAKIVIERRPGEIVFSNPGTMLVSQRQFFEGGQSVCRNQSLQVMFSLMGAGDQAGSGGDVILHGWKDENFRTPYIVESSRPDKVELVLPLESIMSNSAKESLIMRFGENIMNIDHTSQIVLALAVNGDVTNEKVRYSLDLHSADVTQLLRKLCRDGYLTSYGIGRSTRYKLAETNTSIKGKAIDKVKALKNSVIDDKNDKADGKDADKVKGLKNRDVTAKIGRTDGKAKSKGHRNVMALMNELKLYCREWRKSSEMARHVGESPQYILKRVIPEMINLGLLVKEYPDSATHPAQRYRAK